MWLNHRAWIPIAWGLAAVNVVAVWFAAQPGEPMHASIHALLAVGCALGARHLQARRQDAIPDEALQELLDQNEQLQQTVADLQAGRLELEERVDFAERVLGQQREAARLTEPPR